MVTAMEGLFVETAAFVALNLCLYIAATIANADRPVTRRPARRSWWTNRYYGGHRSTW